MPESIPDFTSQISTLERRLRGLRKNIIGCAEAGARALVNTQSAPLFEAQLEAAKSDWEKFQIIWDELDDIHGHAGVDFPSEGWQAKYDACRQEIIQARACMLQIERQRLSETRPVIQQLEDRRSLDATFSTMSGPKAHLPKIPIPVFSGNLKQWTHFRDTFQSLVHNEVGLSNIEKLHYLLSAVKGEASSLISSFPIEDRSYALAWDKLLKTYNNERVLATVFLQQILDFDSRCGSNELQNYERFLTGVADNIQGFKALNLENSAEVLLAFLSLRALDPQTRRQFEISRTSTDTFPSSEEVISFVRQRKIALTISRDIVSPTHHNPDTQVDPKRQVPKRNAAKYRSVNLLHSVNPPSSDARSPRQHSKTASVKQSSRNQSTRCCQFCKDHHDLPGCYKFCNIPLGERQAFVRSLKCCNNCLRQNHRTSECRSKFTCRFCKSRHHSLLHDDKTTPSQSDSQSGTHSRSENPHSTTLSGFGSTPTSLISEGCSTLLGTAEVCIEDDEGHLYSARAVLDSGSQQTFMTLATANKIGLPLTTFKGNITGLGGHPVSKPSGIARCQLKSKESRAKFLTQAVVVDAIAPPLPNLTIPQEKVERLLRFELADRQFHIPGDIDILIGMDLYPHLISGAPFHSGVDQLFLLPTVFGLVVIGKLSDGHVPQSVAFFTESKSSIEENLKTFWEIEEPKPADRQHPEDKLCEEHFIRTTTREPDGRYMVRLPLVTDQASLLGRNRELVTKRFLNLERKFNTDSALAESYKDFMREYQDLRHMSPASTEAAYLIPHHGIWQDRPSGRKLRVVFDASCSSTTAKSLNSILMAGPKLQADLGDVLTTFRLFRIPLCTDLVKMYRQILIHPEDRSFQHVLWRDSQTEALVEMELNTVTYGVRSSAYQALRVIKQLAADEGDRYPLAVAAVQHSMYVDDIACGADTVEEARELQDQLIGLFAKGGFSLSKWASTSSQLIPFDAKTEPVAIGPHGSNSMKILGLVWNPTDDWFSYAVNEPPSSNVTKRIILSSIARIFDPLGLLAPVILLAKVLLQDIWQTKADWDQTLPPEINIAWQAIVSEWHLIPLISVSRYVSYPRASFQLIGFCDASMKAYAASVYLRAQDPSGEVKVSLIKAKTKVAPLGYTSVARLELCGALLLARLLSSINAPKLKENSPICFTDSTVVLCWLRMPVHQLKTFEANRVSQITDTVPPNRWYHVSSLDNPSDLASRGCLPSRLHENSLWWSGPNWLRDPIDAWPHGESLPSACALTANCSTVNEEKASLVRDDWMKRFSDLNLLIRVTALLLKIARHAVSKDTKLSGPTTGGEFKEAKLRCIYIVQQGISTKGISQLSPFVDEAGIIRVGGRLQEAPIEYARRHPILLPREAHFSRLVVDNIHRRNYHAGPSLTLSLLRNEYWIPGALRFIRHRIQQCTECRIRKAKPINPIMAPLPEARFTQCRAFLQVGLDYAGPFCVKDSNRRKATVSKAYLCLFICLTTRALHLEVVSSLSTNAFLAALDRFVSRRGIPQSIWSDHGTNFVGASRFLKDLFKFLAEQEDEIIRNTASKGIEWRFIPPRAPHFGGSWEAGVKSAKSLLAGRMGTQPFTFEELSTAFIRIEGLLNSRPLTPLNEDPENFDVLTPAHFLIGTPITAIPEPDDDSTPRKATDRWEYLQNQLKSIWRRWSRDYLHNLQQRARWTKHRPNLKIGDLVIMVETRSIVGHWPVARISDVHPGKDGTVRTVTVKTPSGKSYIRPVVSLAPLFPIIPDNNA